MKKTIRAPRVGSERWEIKFRLLDRWIHPEDLMGAIHAHLRQSGKARKRISENVIVEDLFIGSLVNNWPPNPQQKEKLIELLSDKKFLERLARAIATGKSQTWDNIDFLILRNWREAHLGPKIIDRSGKKLPGLRDWSPMAAEKLFQFAKLKPEGSWFVTRRKRLGLAGKNRYEIKDLIEDGETARVIR